MYDLSAYPEAVRAVLKAQVKLSQCMVGFGSDDWVQLDLSIGQLKALMLLAGRPDTTVSELADHLNLGRPAASILVDRLVHLGLVQRTEDASDRRRTLVAVTEDAAALITRLRQGKVEQLVGWIESLAPDDLAALRRGLEALAAVAAASNSSESEQHSSHHPVVVTQ